MVKASYQYDTLNRLTQINNVVTIGATCYTYDANGNLTSKADDSDSWTIQAGLELLRLGARFLSRPRLAGGRRARGRWGA